MRPVNAGRPDRGANVFALAIFVAALWAQVDAYAGQQMLDGLNLVLAKALATGQGFAYSYSPEPTPAASPMLYPWILSVLWRAWPDFPDNLVLIRLFGAMTFALVAWGIARYALGLSVSSLAVYAGLGAGMLSPPVMQLGVAHSGELLGVAFLTGAVGIADRCRKEWPWAVAAGVLAGLAGLCARPLVAAIVGVTTAWIFRREWVHAALAGIPGAMIVLPSLVASWAMPEAAGAVSSLGASGVFSGLPSAPATAVTGLVVGLGAWGAYTLRKSARALAVSLVTVAFLVLVGPWPAPRVAWAVWPWITVLAAVGGVRLWAARRALRIPVGLGLGVLSGVVSVAVLAGVLTRSFEEASTRYETQYRLLIPSVVNEVPPDAILAAESPTLIYLYTGHRAVSSVVPAGDTIDDFGVQLCRQGITHVASVRPDDNAVAALRASRRGLHVDFEHRDGASLYSLRCDR